MNPVILAGQDAVQKENLAVNRPLGWLRWPKAEG